MFYETDIIKVLEFSNNNILVMLSGRVFQQTVGILKGANCAPLLADLFLYSYRAEIMHGLLNQNDKKLARSFNCMFHVYSVVHVLWISLCILSCII